MDSGQARAARAMLRLTQAEVAAEICTSSPTLKRFERGERINRATVWALQRAYERRGIVFTPRGVEVEEG